MRRKTRIVFVGDVPLGGQQPIVIQSMLTASTSEPEACIQEALQLKQAGAQLIRLTARNVLEAANMQQIKEGLARQKCYVPLVADIHFSPKAGLVAAGIVEKVRINPGNFMDRKRFQKSSYTESEYQSQLAQVEAAFAPLVQKANAYGCALRIGTNHGSLSDRITNRYGDTPLGMVESALEYARIAQRMHFFDFVISMKASNTKVMIAAYRLLAEKMDEEALDIPLHLGLTEAGMGTPARLKSAIGIGSLLADGLGDTIRVSLTEDSIAEIPVAKEIVRLTRVDRARARASVCSVDSLTNETALRSHPRSAPHASPAPLPHASPDPLPWEMPDAWWQESSWRSIRDWQASSQDAPAKTVPARPAFQAFLKIPFLPLPQLTVALENYQKKGVDSFVFSQQDFVLLAEELVMQTAESMLSFLDRFQIVCLWESDLNLAQLVESEAPVSFQKNMQFLTSLRQRSPQAWQKIDFAIIMNFDFLGASPIGATASPAISPPPPPPSPSPSPAPSPSPSPSPSIPISMASSVTNWFRQLDLDPPQSLWFIARTTVQQWQQWMENHPPQDLSDALLSCGVLRSSLASGHSSAANSVVAPLPFQFSWLVDDENAATATDSLRQGPRQGSSQEKPKKWQPISSAERTLILQRIYRFLVAGFGLPSGEKERRLSPAIILCDRIRMVRAAPMPYDTTIAIGSLLTDGIGQGLFLLPDLVPCHTKPARCVGENAKPAQNAKPTQNDQSFVLEFQLELLQAARIRFSHTEYIACPSCGRTLFSLQETTKRIQEVTDHLPNVKIAVMGCIVNGPGEMADADFGYVGAGVGKVHLYRNKQLVKANIPAERAHQELITLIKENGMWVDKAVAVPISGSGNSWQNIQTIGEHQRKE